MTEEPKCRLLTSSSTCTLSEYHAENCDFGLLISLNDGGPCQLTFLPDANFPNVHPNVYAPASLQQVTKLGGGGSGVAIFSGHVPGDLGDLVMKHGGHKDMKELFALATIAEQLQLRGNASSVNNSETNRAAADMQGRIPEFRMIYISPRHFRERSKALWDRLRKTVMFWAPVEVASLNEMGQSSTNCSTASIGTTRKWHSNNLINGTGSVSSKHEQSINICAYTDDKFSIEMSKDSNCDSLALIFTDGSYEFVNDLTLQLTGDGYAALKTIVDELIPLMQDRLFKFTLGQRTIGGESPRTGNSLLYAGLLQGELLDSFITQFIQVIRDLQILTLPDEVDELETIRKEVARFEDDQTEPDPDGISATADSFVGRAIKKNFHSVNGRARLIRELGRQFRERGLVLTPEEELPAKHLGALLRAGALMGETFHDVPMEPTALEVTQHYWRNILKRAVCENRSAPALRRIWTCGLTDAGIHNLFVSTDKLWFFDLGQPELQSLPGFLTKFLFSFFHTLGMQEDENNTWVRRFEIKGDKLALTKETIDLLPKAYDAFEVCLDRLIVEVFDGDQSLRWLLIQYVSMQLMSDAAFCVKRWQEKGGGRASSSNHNTGIEQWLWRALWDVYVAFDINAKESWSRFGVEHPLH
jgi:hypothetical protein